MKTELKYGMLHTVYTGESIIEEFTVTKVDDDGKEYEEKQQIEKHGSIVCSDSKCGRLVKHNESCFVDAQTGDLFCDACGKCIRFSRKREALRKAIA